MVAYIQTQDRKIMQKRTHLNESDSNIFEALSSVSTDINSKGCTSTAEVFELETCNHRLEATNSTRWVGQFCQDRLISAQRYSTYHIWWIKSHYQKDARSRCMASSDKCKDIFNLKIEEILIRNEFNSLSAGDANVLASLISSLICIQ